ncbi:polyprenyl synthetase family protein [Candidatus Micrarchaeota archaeon]|nr:polyprenyl synthetase family protein [Candidatus Micrarchaeota archaeon]
MDFDQSIISDVKEVEKEMKLLIPKEPKEVYGMLEEYIFRGGKRIRPAMLMLCFRALGGKEKKNAVKAGAIIELFHNFTLMHDDIEDDSQFRRGKPTLHISHGLPIALNSGDALYTNIWNHLLNSLTNHEKTAKLASISGRAFQKVVEGQGIELEWHRTKKVDMSEQDYYTMVGGKTGALMGASCDAGAFLAGADDSTRAKFKNFGESLGIAFQIQDDLLNLVGDFKTYKKEIGGDITEGKRTLMVIHALAHSPESEKKKLIQIINSGTREKKKLDEAISIMEESGSIDYARNKAKQFVKEASSFLEKLPSSKEKESMIGISNYVINRQL